MGEESIKFVVVLQLVCKFAIISESKVGKIKGNVGSLVGQIQRDVTIHPPDWLKWSRWTAPSVGEGAERPELTLLDGVRIVTIAWGVPAKGGRVHTLWLSDFVLKYRPIACMHVRALRDRVLECTLARQCFVTTTTTTKMEAIQTCTKWTKKLWPIPQAAKKKKWIVSTD